MICFYCQVSALNSSIIRADDPYEAIKLTIGKNPVKVTERKGAFFVEALQHGNYRYFGRVIGGYDQPVIAATVMILSSNDSTFLTYGITDENGRFFIPCDHKDVIVKLTSIGYQPTCINSGPFDLGIIKMKGLPVNLNSVSVVADRIRKRDDGIVITPRKRDLEFAANAYDVSRSVPRGSLMLRYMPGNKHTVSLNLNAGNSYPTASTLNSADRVVNEYLLKQGNPSYKPSLMLNSALMYNFFNHRFNMQAMYINNVFTHILLPHYYAEGNKVIYTFDNASTLYQNLGVFFGTLDVGSGLALKTELAVIDNRFSKSLTNSHHTTFRASLDLSYIWKKLMISAGFKVKDKELTSAGIMSESFNKWRCSVRYSLTNWLFEVGAENLFSKTNYLRNSFQSEAYSYNSDIYDRTQQSNIYAKVTFRYNQGKNRKYQEWMLTNNSQAQS